MRKFLIILSYITTSCVATRQVEKSFSKDIQSEAFQNRRFSNCPIDTCGELSWTLLDQLTFKLRNKDSIPDWQNIEIELKKEDKFLGIDIYKNDSLIGTQSLRGKWKNDKFYSKRMIRPMGVPFIFFWYYERKIILKMEKNELILSNGESKFGMMILILNAGVTDYFWSKYRLIDTANTQ